MVKTVTYSKDQKLSVHFNLSEFKCVGTTTIKYSEELINMLEAIFDKCSNVGKAIITSGYRTPENSVKVGGSKNDAHTYGIAVDIIFYDKSNKVISPKYIACISQELGFGGIGVMNNSIHLDVRHLGGYVNAKWWGDETKNYSLSANGKDFYGYYGFNKKDVHKILGVASQPYGYLDGADCHSISGWAYNGTDNAVEVHIYGYKDGQQVFGIPNVTANLYREDLKANGIGNGNHGFCYEYNLAQYGDGAYTIKAFAIGGDNPQLTNDYVVMCTENAEREKAEQEALERAEKEARIKAEQEETERLAKEQEELAEKKEKIAETIEKNVEDITDEEKQNVLSILAEFIIKLIRTIFKKGDK